jgi:hypothetical protein
MSWPRLTRALTLMRFRTASTSPSHSAPPKYLSLRITGLNASGSERVSKSVICKHQSRDFSALPSREDHLLRQPPASLPQLQMDRSFRAPLSRSEVASLRHLGADSKQQISTVHRQLFLKLSLIVAEGDELKLSDAGQARLDGDAPGNMRSSPALKDAG